MKKSEVHFLKTLLLHEMLLRTMHLIAVIILFICSLFSSVLYLYTALFLALCAVSYDFFEEIIQKQLGNGSFFLIATAISIFAHEIHAITIVLIIVLIANIINHTIEEKTEKAIADLFELAPKNAIKVMPNGQYRTTSIKQLSLGDKVIIKPGNKIPVDGVIIEGDAFINEVMLTGESVPRHKKVHDMVFAGTFVDNGSIVVKTTKIGFETELGKIQSLISEAHENKGHIVSLAVKVAWYLTLFIIVLISITWLVTKDLTLITTLLVFGSPVELTLITPLSILAGIAAAFKNGVIIKGGAILETLAKGDTMIFDKTGTLTIGEPRITKIVSYDSHTSERDIIFYMSIAEKRSGHTIAKAILAKAAEYQFTVPEPDSFTSLTGHGIAITYQRNRYMVGNRNFIEDATKGSILIPEHQVYANDTAVYLTRNNSLLGALLIEDSIRGEAKKTIQDIKNVGIKKLMIVSGDKLAIAHKVGVALGISESYGEIMPDKKMEMVKLLQTKGYRVIMVGDGINDAPALMQADVGIAIGAMGTEAAIQSADIVLISNNIHLIVFACRLAQKTIRIIKQNIIWGLFFTHGLGMLLSFMHILNPVQAALFHAIPELIILLNTARILWFKP